MTHYDFLIVGSGLFGATFAYKAHQADKSCLVIDKRPQLGGIVIQQEGLWLYNDEQNYTNYAANKSIWKNFPDLFK